MLQLVTLGMTAFIWYYLVNLQGRKISYLNMFRINSAAGFIESITPSAKLGGEAAKIVLLKKFTDMSNSGLASLTVVKSAATFIPFLGLSLIIFTASLRFYKIPSEVFYSLLVLILIALSGIVLVVKIGCERRRKSGRCVNCENFSLPDEKVVSGMSEWRFPGKLIIRLIAFFTSCSNTIYEAGCTAKKKGLCLMMSISLLEWVLYPVKVYIVSEMFNLQIPIVLITLATFSAYTISVLPVTPGGLGTFEMTMALVLSINGVPFHSGVLLALGARLVTFWMPLIVSVISWGSFCFSSRGCKDKEVLYCES